MFHRVAFVGLLLGLGALPAAAQESACPEGNLLAGLRPSTQQGVSFFARLTDDVVAAEGDPWKSNATALFDGGKAFITYDLQQVTAVRALMLQGDNNDTYQVEVSLDGAAFSPLWTAPAHPQPGMRTRLTQGLDGRARYLRVGFAAGDNAFSLSEVQAFCQQPALWPPPVTTMASKATGDPRQSRLHRLARQKIAVGIMGLILFGGLLLGRRETTPWARYVAPAMGAVIVLFGGWCAWGNTGVGYGLGAVLLAAGLIRQFARGARDPWLWAERAALMGLAAVASFGWTNFGTWHGGRGVHFHEQFHYVLGSKYSEEIGYELLYHCAAVAQDEDGHRKELSNLKVRVLKDNVLLGSGLPVVEDAQTCKQHFSPARWAAFRQDVRLFRSQMGREGIKRAFTDHGYNAAPAWNMVGRWIANRDWQSKIPPDEMVFTTPNLAGKTPAQRTAMRERWEKDKARFLADTRQFAQVDAVLYAGLFLLIGWAFGLRALALATLVWYVGHPWSYYWTGGGFARAPWLFMAVAGMCFMKKGMHALGGAGITWSMLLRVFPGALIAGVAAKIGWTLVRERTISVPHRKLILGCVAALVVLAAVPLAVPSSGGGEYKAFLANSFKHKETGLTNHMGMPTLFAFETKFLGRHVRDNAADDPWAVWKQRRHEVLQARRIPFAITVLALLALLTYIGRRREDWEVTALSTVFIFALFQLTCYYYIFCIMLAPVVLRHYRYVLALLGMCVATQLVHLDGGWIDEMYLKESAITAVFYLYLLGDMAWEIYQDDKARLAAPASDDAAPAPEDGEAAPA